MRDLPAYDQIVQGVAGVMAITGAPDTAPYRVGYPVCDTIGGLTAAMAVAAALAGRDRAGGTLIDVSMLEATLATMGWVVSNWLIAGARPRPHGNENVTAAPSGTFDTADGPLNIAANKQEQWQALCRHLGRDDLLADPAYRTREDRKANRLALKVALEASLRSKGAREWAGELNALGVPAGPVLTLPDALAQSQIADRGMIATFEDVPGAGRDIRVARTGLKLDGRAPAVDTPPPRLGQHNVEIYGALGLTAGEIAALEKDGVV